MGWRNLTQAPFLMRNGVNLSLVPSSSSIEFDKQLI
jgi:hypothetical protein